MISTGKKKVTLPYKISDKYLPTVEIFLHQFLKSEFFLPNQIFLIPKVLMEVK